MMLMALFWLTNIFATLYGEHEAKSTAAAVGQETGVVDTTDRLNLPANLIVETPLTSGVGDASPQTDASEAVTYRYKCFRSLAVHKDQWVLVPAKWTPNMDTRS